MVGSGRPLLHAMLRPMSSNKNGNLLGPSPLSSEQRIVAGAIALLLFLVVSFLLVSCQGSDTPTQTRVPAARAQGTQSKPAGKTTSGGAGNAKPSGPEVRYFGPWRTPAMRDRALSRLPARIEGRAAAITGIFNGGYGIRIRRR